MEKLLPSRLLKHSNWPVNSTSASGIKTRPIPWRQSRKRIFVIDWVGVFENNRCTRLIPGVGCRRGVVHGAALCYRLHWYSLFLCLLPRIFRNYLFPHKFRPVNYGIFIMQVIYDGSLIKCPEFSQTRICQPSSSLPAYSPSLVRVARSSVSVIVNQSFLYSSLFSPPSIPLSLSLPYM